MKPPQFIVIGAQKSASSFLQVCLTEHPDIWMPVGETPYFESPDYEAHEPGDLESIFAGRPEPMCGIKRPNYIGKPEVPPRIAADRPDAKLIAVLRNPIDRALSSYFHQVKSGFLPPLPPEEGIPALLDDPSFGDRHPRSREILEFGLYHKYLSLYEPFRAADRLLVMRHKQILKQPRESIQLAYRFLGVDDAFVPEDSLGSRPQAVIYQPTRLKLLAWRPRLLYRFNAERTRMIGRTRNPLRIGLAGAIIALDRLILARLLGNAKPRLSPELRARLRGYYDADIAKLEGLLGQDFSDWT